MDDLPPAAQIAAPRSARQPRIQTPPTEILRVDQATFTLGPTAVEAAPGETVRVVTTTERTIVDVVRLRGRFGDAIAYAALLR